MTPPRAMRLILNIFGLPDVIDSFRRMTFHIFGHILPDEALYTPVHEQPKIFIVARIWGLFFAITLASALYFQSFIPLLLIKGRVSMALGISL